MKAKERDRFGACVKCHKNLLREVIDRGNVVLAPTPDLGHEDVLLSNGSQMRVCVCKKCKKSLKDEDFDYLMDAVIQGWDWETTQLVNNPKKTLWDKKKKKEYMARHRKLKIVSKAKGINKAQKSERLRKHNSKNKREE